MDLNFLYFFVSLSIVLYFISRITQTPWIRLSLGWIAGGIFIVIGLLIVSGEDITSTVAFGIGSNEAITLDFGIATDYFLIFTLLIGVVMIFSSSGEWI